MVIFFLREWETRGWDEMGGNRKQRWTPQNHALPRNSTWTWKQVERLRENVVLLRPTLRVLFSIHLSFSIYSGVNDITGQTLSPPRRLQHLYVEFFHNLVLIAVTDSGLYLATIVTSSSNADTRLLSLHLGKPWKMRPRTIDNAGKAALETNVAFVPHGYIICHCKKN